MNDTMANVLPYRVDLNKPIKRKYLDTLLATGDHEAHRFDIELVRNGEAATIPSGALVYGYFIKHSCKPDEEDSMVVLEGSAEGNVASVKLDKACYAKTCQFSFVIKVTVGEEITSIFWGDGTVMRSQSDTIEDPTNVVHDLDTLLAQIAAMEAAMADSIAAAQEAMDAAAEADAAREAIQDDLNQVKATKDIKADAIIDTSAKAASHELYAQDAPMHVTLYGATTQSGSGDPSPDNVRPISGVDAAEIRAGGKNLLDVSRAELGAFDQTTGEPVAGAGSQMRTTYDILCEGKVMSFYNSDALNVRAFFWGDSGYIGTVAVYSGSSFAAPNGATRMRLTSSGSGFIGDNQLEFGNVVTTYEPYNATVITPPLLPPTIYDADGNVIKEVDPLMEDDTTENDVLSGCDGKITLTGAENWKRESAGWFYCDFPETNVITNTSAEVTSIAMYSNWLRHHNPTTGIFNTFNWMYSSGSNRLGCCVDAEDVDEFKKILAANSLTVYYRSTEYTPEKDLRVCKVTRHWKNGTISGFTTIGSTQYEFVQYHTFIKPSDAYDYTKWSGTGIVGESFAPEITGSFNGTERIGTITGNIANKYYCIGFPPGTTIEEAEAAFVGSSYIYKLAKPEVYMSDHQVLRKPSGMMPVTVTGSGETEVTYAHDTKHYIDSKISELVTLALANH